VLIFNRRQIYNDLVQLSTKTTNLRYSILMHENSSLCYDLWCHAIDCLIWFVSLSFCFSIFLLSSLKCILFCFQSNVFYYFAVHPKFGFGLMNAEGIVNMVKIWRTVATQQIYNTTISGQLV
jgi:hypothetical protein